MKDNRASGMADDAAQEADSELNEQVAFGNLLAKHAAIFLNLVYRASPLFAKRLVNHQVPLPEDMVQAGKEGRVPFSVSKRQDGSYQTSLLGMMNGFCQYLQAEDVVVADAQQNKHGEIVNVKGFDVLRAEDLRKAQSAILEDVKREINRGGA